MNNLKRSSFACPKTELSVVIFKQVIPLGYCIGGDSPSFQIDYECSKADECPHRTSEECRVRQLNG